MAQTKRCPWSGNDPLMIEYHDTEWGVPLHQDRKIYEFLVLEGMQAGLSWSTVLRKRENFRAAFRGFDPAIVSEFGSRDVERLVSDPGIIRNRLKIEAAVTNAQCFLAVQKEFGSFDRYIWEFVGGKPIRHGFRQVSDIPPTSPESDRLSKDMKQRGFKFVGSTIVYAHMQATGMVNDHLTGCFRYKQLGTLPLCYDSGPIHLHRSNRRPHMGTILGSGMLNQQVGLPGDWAQLTPEQKREWRLNNFLSPKNLQFISEKAKNDYKVRAQRLVDVYNVKEPDRVPVNLPVGNLAYTNYGINYRTAMYDYEKAMAACKKFNEEYSEELEYWASPWVTPGRVLDLLDYKLYSWPGHRLGENVSSVQFMESEYMKADEYDAFILDPSDFWIRTYMPRIFGALEPLRMFRPITDMVEIVNMGQFMPFASPEGQKMLQTLMDVGKEYQKMMKAMAEAGPSGAAHGYPVAFGAFCKAPFDTLGDSLRGTQPILKDMYRRPDKLLEALDVIADFTISSLLSAPNVSNIFMVTYPLHKGADGWMSQKQFDTFYWPSLKKVMNALINEGLIQNMFAEGGYNTRLESINEFPKGTVCWYFDKTDMFKAKQILGNKCAIQGNVPSSLIVTGTATDTKEYCRKLIEGCGKGGGFILSAGAIADNPKLENLRAMLAAVREYGVNKK